MLARLQQCLVVMLLLAAAAAAAGLVAAGHPLWGAGLAAMILIGHALFLALEFVLLHIVQRRGRPSEQAPRARAGQLVAAWWAEVITAPQVFFWRQPFRSHVEPDEVPERPGGRRGVVLVHGLVCNRGLWNPWMAELRTLGAPRIAVNLEPLFGSIEHYVDAIESAVLRLERSTGQPVVLVGHSMGGLAIRSWLRRFDADARVHRIITIGTPHQGTWLARFAATVNGAEMRQGSSWLTQLASTEPASRGGLFTCFYGHCDNIVFPAACGTLPGAANRHLAGTAHVHMAFQRVVFNELLRWLTTGEESTPVAAPRRVEAAR